LCSSGERFKAHFNFIGEKVLKWSCECDKLNHGVLTDENIEESAPNNVKEGKEVKEGRATDSFCAMKVYEENRV
jgi:hypothetical protein